MTVLIAYALLALFFASAVIHLICCWRGKPKSAYTKPLLVSTLALFCVFVGTPRPWLLIAALFMSWLGDVLLMPKGNKWFVSGGVSFLISHILFIFVYLSHIHWAGAPWWAAILAAAVYFAVSALVILSIRKQVEPKAMRIPLFLYLAANSMMNVFALMLLLSAPGLGTAFAYIGAVSFFASDCILFLARYRGEKAPIPKSGFLIMLTYIAGEALIALGMLAVKHLLF